MFYVESKEKIRGKGLGLVSNNTRLVQIVTRIHFWICVTIPIGTMYWMQQT